MKKILCLVAVMAMMTFASAAWADTTTGQLYFGANPTNYFDPANGFVPGGYGNSVSPVNVTIGAGVEFGFQDGANTDTANFTGTQLIIEDVVNGIQSDAPWTMIFSNPGYTGMTLFAGSFPGTFTYSLDASFITINWGGGEVQGAMRAVFDLQAVPEPGSLMLLGSGLVGLAGVVRRKLSL